ncbi:helix-turn-helix transcriptional regulator [Bacillus sp. 37MA]|uniref:helix-turn-helix domain-containing protein n=1 Tax=Bacillus sp. 37MA TaxID=1132442 RepID=UPI00036825F5|nr:helix-turn-helix transcriptional regulator [Bacillus sp. 37MA]
MELGDKLKKLRQENGYSQNELADKLHVTAQAVSKWENNKSIPDIINLVLVQKLRDSCKSSLNLGHTDTITLKKTRDQY